MLSVTEAQRRIQERLKPISGWERVPLRAALGCILAEDLIAPFDVPAYTNAAMDGYAVRHADLTADTALVVIGEAFAGHPFTGAVGPGQAVRIMTGAPMPLGADTVIPQELCVREENRVKPTATLAVGEHVRAAGEDLARGQVALPRGRRLGPAELGLIGSLGFTDVRVVRRLRCAVLSTGDEVAAAGQPLGAGQIYDSNRHSLTAALTRLGCEVLDLGIVRDDPAALRAAFTTAAEAADVVVTSGGVSVGEADFIRTLIAELGEVAFWQLAIKPGRPLAFGRIGQAWLFGLPGNPVAVLVAYAAFVREALRLLQGETPVMPPIPGIATLTHPVRKKPGRREYVRARVETGAEGLTASMVGAQGSGILSSMTGANAFLILSEDTADLPAGAAVQFLWFDQLF